MPDPITNRIVTRGMGHSQNRIITLGYGRRPPAFVVQTIKRNVVGQSGTKRRLREMQTVIVWAKMVEINGNVPPVEIKGFVRVHVDRARNFASVIAEHVSTKVRSAWDDINVIVKRIK